MNRGITAHIVKLTELRGQTETCTLPLMTELTALCSLRQAERNPSAHHKDCTISQLADRAGKQIMTAEPFKSCHPPQLGRMQQCSAWGDQRGCFQRKIELSLINYIQNIFRFSLIPGASFSIGYAYQYFHVGGGDGHVVITKHSC